MNAPLNADWPSALERAADGWSAWMIGVSWQLAVVVAALAALSWLLRRRSAALLHALWMLALLRLVLPPDLAAPTGWGWWLAEGRTTVEPTAPLPKQPARFKHAAEDVKVQTEPPIEEATSRDSSAPGDARPTTVRWPSEAVGGRRENGDGLGGPSYGAKAPSKETTTVPAEARSWAVPLMLGWSGAAATLLGLLAWGHLRTRRWVRQARTIDDAGVLRLFERCREQLGVRRQVALRNSEHCCTPLVVGVLRPTILLPDQVTAGLEPEEMRSVLLHELNHVRRRDPLWNLAQAALTAVYFFHPLVWWTGLRLARYREEACDELTVTALDGRRRAYGSAMVKVTESLGYQPPALASCVMETKASALRRLRRILDPRLPQANGLGAGSLLFVLLLGAVLLPAGSPPPDAQAGGKPDIPPLATRNLADVSPLEAPPEEAIANPALRYAWQDGDTYTYDVRIEAQDSGWIETLTGQTSYRVVSLDSSGARLAFAANVVPGRRRRADSDFQRVTGPPLFASFPRGPGGLPGERELTVDDRGRVVRSRGDWPLPLLIGDLTRLPLVRLPQEPAIQWETTDTRSIEVGDERFPRWSIAGRMHRESLPAAGAARWRVTQTAEDVATLEADYTLRTTEQVRGRPRFEVTGQYRAEFDRRRGLVSRLQADLRVTNSGEFGSETVPVKVSLTLPDEAELARRRQAAIEASRPLSADERRELLADLKSGDSERIAGAVERLGQAAVDDDPRLPAALEELALREASGSSRSQIAEAFARWATRENVPALVRMLDDESTGVRWAAIEALGRLREPGAIGPLVERLGVDIDRLSAAAALKRMGPAAESAVLPLAEHPEWPVRMAVLGILEDAATSASVATLRRLAADDPNASVRSRAGALLARLNE